MDTKTTADGRVWISCDVFVTGDYGGAGSVGAANIRSLQSDNEKTFEQISMSDWERGDELTRGADGHSVWTPVNPDSETTMVLTYGSYSSNQAWLLDTPENRETIDAMEDYPCIADEEVAAVEMDWENEAWDSWLKAALLRAVGKYDADLRDLVDELDNDTLFQAYRDAMETTNTYPEAEYSGVHVDVDRIASVFIDNVVDVLGR